MGNAQYLMKEFPLIDLFAMLYWKPSVSLADFLSAWGGGKGKESAKRVIESDSLADMDNAMRNENHPQYANPK